MVSLILVVYQLSSTLNCQDNLIYPFIIAIWVNLVLLFCRFVYLDFFNVMNRTQPIKFKIKFMTLHGDCQNLNQIGLLENRHHIFKFGHFVWTMASGVIVLSDPVYNFISWSLLYND